jgi:integrase/recombinase XerD
MTDNPPEASDNAYYRTGPEAVGSASNPQNSADFLIRAWLHNRPATTTRAYRRDAEAFLAHAKKPLTEVNVADLQAWEVSLAASAPASRARRLAAVAKPTAGALRVLAEADVQRMIGAETDARSRVALRVLYATGIRNSELCSLRRRDLTAAKKGVAEARVVGKGGKVRIVVVPAAIYRDLVDLAPAAKPDEPAITGRDGKPLHPRALHRLVRRAARRVGLAGVSPHWMRHAHASHALDNGAPPHLVQQGLGHASLATTTRYLHVRAGDSSSAYVPA